MLKSDLESRQATAAPDAPDPTMRMSVLGCVMVKIVCLSAHAGLINLRKSYHRSRRFELGEFVGIYLANVSRDPETQLVPCSRVY